MGQRELYDLICKLPTDSTVPLILKPITNQLLVPPTNVGTVCMRLQMWTRAIVLKRCSQMQCWRSGCFGSEA